MFNECSDSHLLFFFGAGVSKPSNLPLASEIDIFRDDLIWNGAIGRYGPPRGVRKDGYSRRQADQVRDFLRVVENKTQNYFDEQAQEQDVVPREVNYEDIYFLCERMQEHERGRSRDPALEHFAESIRDETSEYLLRDPRDERGPGHPFRRQKTKLEYTGELGNRLILSVVREELDKNVDIEGFRALLSAIQSGETDKIDIVTLNNDVIIEGLLRENNIEFESGFKRYKENLKVYYPSRIFTEDIKVRMIKPHGSISWYLSGDENVGESSGSGSGAVYVSVDPPESSDPYPTGVADKYDIVTSLPSLLSSYGKEREYGKNIYGDMTTALQLSVRSADSIVVSGYGWSDNGMNDRLLATLNRDKIDQLTLLRDVSNSEHVPTTVRYLLEEDRATVVDDWLCNVTWDELQKRIA